MSIGKDVTRRKNAVGILTAKESEEIQEMKRQIEAERAQRRIEEGKGKVKFPTEIKDKSIAGELPHEEKLGEAPFDEERIIHIKKRRQA